MTSKMDEQINALLDRRNDAGGIEPKILTLVTRKDDQLIPLFNECVKIKEDAHAQTCETKKVQEKCCEEKKKELYSCFEAWQLEVSDC